MTNPGDSDADQIPGRSGSEDASEEPGDVRRTDSSVLGVPAGGFQANCSVGGQDLRAAELHCFSDEEKRKFAQVSRNFSAVVLPDGHDRQEGAQEGFETGDALFRYALSLCKKEGVKYAPRGIPVLEVPRPVTLTLNNVHQPFVMSRARRPNYRFGLAEACWILSGGDGAQRIARFNKNMLNYSDDGTSMWGAYGPRLMGQLPHVISTLRRDPDSRQAVATTWRPMVESVYSPTPSKPLAHAGVVQYPYDDDIPEWDGASWRSKDVPCTVAWHFQLRDGKLNLTVLMRSNDVWLGLPYDILSFTTVQRVVASCLGVDAGVYNHVVSNLHAYESNIDAINGVLAEATPTETIELPPIHKRMFLDVSTVRKVFRNLLTTKETLLGLADGLAPFASAIHRDDTWESWEALKTANGRNRPRKA